MLEIYPDKAAILIGYNFSFWLFNGKNPIRVVIDYDNTLKPKIPITQKSNES